MIRIKKLTLSNRQTLAFQCFCVSVYLTKQNRIILKIHDYLVIKKLEGVKDK